MKGRFYPKMINSKLFTTLLRYKVNDDNNYDTICNEIVARLNTMLEEERFTYLLNIIDADFAYKMDCSEKPYVEIVVMIYATVKSTAASDKVTRKLFADFIDSNCSEFEDLPAILVSRHIA